MEVEIRPAGASRARTAMAISSQYQILRRMISNEIDKAISDKQFKTTVVFPDALAFTSENIEEMISELKELGYGIDGIGRHPDRVTITTFTIKW